MTFVVKEVVWDDFNIAHIGEYDVSVDEVEEVCNGKVEAYLGHSDRFMIIGKTVAGRILSIVLAQKSKGVVYPVTARDASRKERGWIKND
ncbi:hypothetical protein HZB78_02045 [Candidatus Collierbacteria bacterium]|nr:hypothetical protein [Candidatus Collierbacteria bacterium]